jgi:hypothetical protein
MINVKFNSKQFAKDMKNIVEYSSGFIEGAHKGKKAMLENVGQEVLQGLKQFIDTKTRIWGKIFNLSYLYFDSYYEYVRVWAKSFACIW